MGISLRIVIALLIAVATIIATLVAFIPTYLSGVTAVRSTLGDLRRAYVARTEEGIETFFDLPIATLTDLHTAVVHDLVNLTDSENWTRWLSNYTKHYSHSITAGFYHIWVDPGQSDPLFRSIDNRLVDVYGSLLIYSNATTYTAALYDTENYASLGILAQLPLPTNYQSDEEIFARANPTATVKWTPVIGGFRTPALFAVMIIPDKTASTPTARGCIAAQMTPTSLTDFFESLQLRSGGRAILVDGDSGVMMGNSWGEETAVDLDNPNVFADASERLQLKTLANHSDATIHDVVSHLGADTILNGAVPFTTDLHTGRELTFVDVLEVTGPGLRMRLLLVMPEIDFMETVYDSQTSTIILVVVLALVVIVFGTIVAHRLVVPLVELQHRMELTASLKDAEDEGVSLSIFSEVGDMQHAYRRMKAELNRMKSYLPQSVLYPNNTTDEDEAEDEMEASGAKSASAQSGSNPSASYNKSVNYSPSASYNQSASYKRQSSTGDTRSASFRAAPIANGGLNTRGDIVEKRVTVAVFNLKSFHLAGRAGNLAEMTKLQKDYLQIIQRATRESKGVVDVFQGDHVTCSFNAVGHCVASNRKAVLVATHVVEAFQQCPVTVGISSGTAAVGNMGTDEMRRFCIVGPVVPQAMALERLTKRYSPAVRILVSHSMLEDVQYECKYAVVDRIRLPGNQKPQLVAAVLGLQVKSDTEEWMYNLADDAKSNPYQLLNQAWANVLVGRSEVSTKLTEVDKELEAIETSTAPAQVSNDKTKGGPRTLSPAFREVIDDSVQTLSGLVSNNCRDATGWDAGKVCTELGPFFTECLL